MTHQQLSEALQDMQYHLHANDQAMTPHQAQLSEEIHRLQWVMFHDGILSVENRIIALLALKEVLLVEVPNPNERERMNEVIAFVWWNMQSLTSPEFVAEFLGIGKDRVLYAADRNRLAA